MIVYAIFATVSWFIIERAGRRKLFLWGTVGQGLSMVLVFSCLIPGTTTAANGAAVGLFTYIASFGATWLPLPWVCSYSMSNRVILISASYTLPRSIRSRSAPKPTPCPHARIGCSTSVRSPLQYTPYDRLIEHSHRHDYPYYDYEHRLGYLPLLRRRQCLLHPPNLLYLP